MRKRLGVAVGALILGLQMGLPTAAAGATVDDLEAISAMIESRDIEGLIVFLKRNPGLSEGDGPLAVRLREFMAAADDLSEYLAFDPLTEALVAEGFLEEGSSLY
jgi:RNase H-fold protein (predicted Holliday junction resolvase)